MNNTQKGKEMTRSVYELQGYAIVLDKILFVTRVFEAGEGEGYQFNLRFGGDTRLTPKYPTRHEADLAREVLLREIRQS
jgi:hypothetical protein